jgi:thymidylate kinase
MDTLELVRALACELDRRKVRYCHWKSNASLHEAVLGVGDLDLLVDPTHLSEFEAALASLGFVEVVTLDGPSAQGTRHFVGLDDPTSRLVHLDVYTRLLTGGTLLKNHHLPLEDLLFESVHRDSPLPVPSRAAELVLLVIRKSIESGSVLEHALLQREYERVRLELDWLGVDGATRVEAQALVACWLPMLDLVLFDRCLVALRNPRSVLERWLLGRQLQRVLRAYEVLPAWRARLERLRRLKRRMFGRLGLTPRRFRLRSGGAIIAFLGPEASGKSTLVEQTTAWLSEVFDVHQIRSGTPPASVLTALPNLLLPLLRAALPAYRTSSLETSSLSHIARKRSAGLWLYLLRCVAIGDDRRRLLSRAARFKREGAIVISDRYPTMYRGFVDSRQLDELSLAAAGHAPAAWLARLESRLYASVPPADLVLTCYLPMAEMLKRNAERDKVGGPEPEDYVRRRHVLFLERLPEEFCRNILDTTEPLEQTLRKVRRLIWHALVMRSAA